MIVLSGLLVVVAIACLLIGLIIDTDGLGWVYGSIVTSLVAGALLILGAMQRRGEAPAEGAAVPGTGGEDAYDRISAVSVTRPAETATAAAAAEAAPAATGGKKVSVVPGRPRYHTDSCRFLAGRSDVTQVPVEQARSEGYSACGVCKPDQEEAAPAAAAPEMPAVAAPEEILAAAEPAADGAAPARRRATATATATATRGTRAATAAAKAPAKTARAATTPPAKTAAKPAAKTAAKPAKAVAAAPAVAEKPAKPAKAAKTVAAAAEKPAKAATSAKVVVIPDRDKFHKDSCRFVKDVPGTVSLTKPAAQKQGFVPCGVCKP